MTKKPRIASVDDPSILAAVRGYFRYEQEWQARETLDKIRDHYVRAKEQDDPAGVAYPTVRLWVKGFNVGKDEKQQGYAGHFVRLSVQAAEGGKWTIAAEKLPVALNKHPQKQGHKERHPNWGHPVLQAVETAKIFPGIEIARAQLQALHLEYPDATIPGKDVVHVMVYNRRKNPDAPIEKITIKVKPLSDGSAKLMLKPKTDKKKNPLPLPKAETPVETKGKFTAMVMKKKPKKA